MIMTIDSIETGEGYRLFSSGTAGVAGTDFHDFLSTHTGQVVQSYQLTLTQDYLGLSAYYDGATQGDVFAQFRYLYCGLGAGTTSHCIGPRWDRGSKRSLATPTPSS